MNLSKIAAGVAVSLCLVSNVVIAKTYNLSIEEKAEKKFKEYYKLSDYEKWEKNQIHEKDITEEQKKNLWRTWGYQYSALGLKQWLGSDGDDDGGALDLAHYYSLKILNDEINTNMETISDNSKNIDVNKESINANKENINANKENINANKELITKYKKNIESNMTDNRRLIVANTASITDNQALIEKNTARITLNHDAIKKLTSDLANLKTSLKRGLATQSALNGLFQPYNVGKFNITAALGGYQSQTAIAVGTGYRFNEKIAAKAGIAKSVKGAALSYNVGVNYEF